MSVCKSQNISVGGSYADQPYLARLPDGSWFCTVTTAQGEEGHPSQGVHVLRSSDQGATWSRPAPIEPPGSPENSYSVPLVTPSGRVYVFYNFNTQNIRSVKTEDGGEFTRVDSLGDYVFRYSDDAGETWSERHVVPVREFLCDRNNVYGGAARFFWNVGKPLIRSNGEVIIPLHKVGAMGNGFFAQSEGAFIKSPNILTEADPTKLMWETLPDGELGLTTPPGGGRIAEEHSLVELSDGTLYTVYRSVDGYPVCATSKDGGHTWSKPLYQSYRPGGKLMKNPRAANFIWKLSGGRYLYWFHNHGGQFIRGLDGHASLPNGLSPVAGRSPYDDRNPVWLCAGLEHDGPDGKTLIWSEPEIFLYDDDPFVRMSYPDLLEEDGRVWISETNKSVARLHEVSAKFLDAVFGALRVKPVSCKDGIAVQIPEVGEKVAEFPRLPNFLDRDYESMTHGRKDLRAGFTITISFEGLPAVGETLLDTRNEEGAGIYLNIVRHGVLEWRMSDGRTVAVWGSDSGSLRSEGENHVSIIVDGGPKLILIVVNGELNDGGETRQFGWGRFSPNLWDVNGRDQATVSPEVSRLIIHSRALMVAEVLGLRERISATKDRVGMMPISA